MVAVRIFCLLFAFALLTSCNESKSTSNVFPESYSQGRFCGEERAIKNQFVVSWEDGRITREFAANSDEFISEFLEPNLSQIKYVEFNKYLSPAVMPKARQHSDLNPQSQPMCSSAIPGFSADWHIRTVEAPAVWAQGFRGQGVKVAVLDTGIDFSHPKLKGNLVVNAAEASGKAGVDDDGNGLVDDLHGYDFLNMSGDNFPELHGTHVAGIIAADDGVTLGTGAEPVGIAPEAQLIGAKFLGDGPDSGTIFKAIEAIHYAASAGSKIVNASWGGDGCSETLKSVIQSYSNQMLFIAAAGNNGRDLDIMPSFPAAFVLSNQITVAATQSNDFLAGFSNTSFKYVHVGAPGSNILSTVPMITSNPGIETGNPYGYDCQSGTSMATPVVSGAAALLWSAYPQAHVGQVRDALMKGVDSRSYRVSTRGRVNIQKALEALRNLM